MRGLSGLGRDESGALWVIGERDHALLSVSAKDGRTLSRRTIAGIDEGIDLESLTVLGDSRLALGSERSTDGRAYDTIYMVDIAGDEARVTDHIELRYDLVSIESRGNQGIEGLCAAGSTLLAALETPVERDGARLAALARYDLRAGTWTATWLQLTSGSGKISALDCRRRGDVLDVLAIERHFEVMRILRMSVPLAGDAGVVQPTVALDLGPLLIDKENFEGIVWLGDSSAALVLDNDFGSISGPNRLLIATF